MANDLSKSVGDPTLRKRFRILGLSVLVFFLIYNITFRSFPILTTGRLSVLILVIWTVFLMRKHPIRILKSPALLLFIPLPFVVAQYLLVGDPGQLSRFFHLGMYSFLGAALVALIARNPREAMAAILIAISFQAIFSPYAFVSSSYRDWYSVTIESGANFGADYLYRTNGFSGYAGAALSLIQSLGVFVGWMLLRDSCDNRQVTGIRSNIVIIAMTACLASCFVVGRTGLVLSVVFYLGYLLYPDGRDRVIRGKHLLLMAFVAGFGFVLVRYYFVDLLSDDFSVEYFGKWALGFLWGEEQTAAGIAEMVIPPLGVDTIFGTGLVSLVEGSNPSGHDSGFIQSYYSMGLLISFAMYAVYAYVLYYSLHWLPFMLRIFITAIFFILELKEPFLFKYSLLFVVLALHFSYVKSRNVNHPKARIR